MKINLIYSIAMMLLIAFSVAKATDSSSENKKGAPQTPLFYFH
ncbi:Hypothetical protein Bdt_0773 [Bdellovibrio bacteriovorus str. Tiberius]|uniref:Uncharacterized protein n=1 Tax=Bdellovibrio bacteriovorus str. Tiberius TaxID=1069642 RepID=K7Z7Z5_BDEBC|nr:Hypothetical protein Bdt_0773 [Bdellovibrio bacteriovorus str. Tiberius]